MTGRPDQMTREYLFYQMDKLRDRVASGQIEYERTLEALELADSQGNIRQVVGGVDRDLGTVVLVPLDL